MKADELAKLTPEEKRIRIAELRGWKWADFGRDSRDRYWFVAPQFQERYLPHVYVSRPDIETTSFCVYQGEKHLPDYLNDRDAMHAAAKLLNRDQQRTMILHLLAILDIEREAALGPVEITCACVLFDATASDLADAFLLTMGDAVLAPAVTMETA